MRAPCSFLTDSGEKGAAGSIPELERRRLRETDRVATNDTDGGAGKTAVSSLSCSPTSRVEDLNSLQPLAGCHPVECADVPGARWSELSRQPWCGVRRRSTSSTNSVLL
jgi:hypothetical protein